MKVLSINLWNINKPLGLRMENLSAFIGAESPDVICFQEVTPLNGVPQIDNILKQHGYSYEYRMSGLWQGREEGLAIAARHEINNFASRELPNDDNWHDMQRLLVSADIVVEDIKISIYNTHLAYHLNSESARKVQTATILELIDQNAHAPDDLFILCGDFNEDPKVNNIYPMITNHGLLLKDTWEGETNTFSSHNHYVEKRLWPDRRIDYIFCSPKLRLKSRAAMCETDGFLLCSDHYGVIAHGGVML